MVRKSPKANTRRVTQLGTEIEPMPFDSDDAVVAYSKSIGHRTMEVPTGKYPIDVEYVAECIKCDALIIREGEGTYSGTAINSECHVGRAKR